MGTEILRPQDCFIERIRVPPAAFSRRKSYGNYCNYYNNHGPSSRSSRKPATRPERKRVAAGWSADDCRMEKSSGFVMEKVTILRRGESLDSKLKSEDVNPGTLSVAVKSDVYAGSAFAVSPSPSSLPLPSFPKKDASAVVDDSATRDLRRLLRLE